ncbi:MAG: acyltransferase [Neomegalonema sp.]|nr:acyltransferase [Neomegalonema sp.]
MNSTKEHYPWLDWLRFLAALLVVLVHTRSVSFVAYGELPASDQNPLVAIFFLITRLGDQAVMAFFVLSGFLVGGRAIERLAHGAFRPADYMLDRVTRIMTPLVPALIFAAIVGVLVGRGFDASGFACNLVSLQGVFCKPYATNIPLWSLAYEMWFYILVWIVGAAIVAQRFTTLTIVAGAVGLIIFTQLQAVYLFCWLVGALAYGFRPTKPSWIEAAVALVLMGIGVVGEQAALESKSFAVEELRAWLPSHSASQIYWSTGIALLMRQALTLPARSPRMKKLDAWGATLAGPSYSLYLTHLPTLFVIDYIAFEKAASLSFMGVGQFVVRVALCLLVAWLFYWAFERHTGEIRRWAKARWLTNLQKAGADGRAT